MKLYMHTINGAPAAYHYGEQIYYAGKSVKVSDMCYSLANIRREQKKTRAWRTKMGFSLDHDFYGYIIVYLDK